MSDLEERLRTAVHTEAGRIEPDVTTSLDAIRARGRVARRRRRLVGGSVTVLALVLVAAVVLPTRPDDGRQDIDLTDRSTSSTTTTRPETTTRPTAPTTTPAVPSTTAAPPTSQPTGPSPEAPAAEAPTTPATPVLWPGPGHPGFTDPVAAADSFTREAIGFGDPALSGFRPGGTPDRGQVDVYSLTEDGRPMDHVASSLSLLQHQGRWYVTEARAGSVVVDSPGPGSRVGSPLTVQGRGISFEGTIYVEVRAAFAPSGQVLARAITAAGALEELEPYSATLTFTPPGGAGAVVVTNDTGVTGGTVSFTAFPVSFG